MNKVLVLLSLLLFTFWGKAQQKANYKLAEKLRNVSLGSLIGKYSMDVFPKQINNTDKFWFEFTTEEGKNFYFVDPVTVEMVYQFAGGSRAVFIDNGECRAVDYVFHAELFTKGFDESGFPGSHVAVKRIDGFVAHLCDEFSVGIVYLIQIFYFDRFHIRVLFIDSFGGIGLFAGKGNEWNHHLFHRDSAVLERIFVISHVVVVVVGIGEEIAVGGENIGGADVGRRQSEPFGRFYLIHLLRIVRQRFAYLVP